MYYQNGTGIGFINFCYPKASKPITIAEYFFLETRMWDGSRSRTENSFHFLRRKYREFSVFTEVDFGKPACGSFGKER
jgi:hypothetical protein